MLPQLDIDLVYHLEDAPGQLCLNPDQRIEQAAQWIAERFAIDNLYVSIAIVDDQTMRQLNAERLGHDWSTDVISFVLDQHQQAVEGEVIASAQTAARLASQAGWSVEDELLLYVIHGLLHVVGLDDVELDERCEMRKLEQACLLSLGVERAAQVFSRFEQVTDPEVEP